MAASRLAVRVGDGECVFGGSSGLRYQAATTARYLTVFVARCRTLFADDTADDPVPTILPTTLPTILL